jgi:hypothetical protein
VEIFFIDMMSSVMAAASGSELIQDFQIISLKLRFTLKDGCLSNLLDEAEGSFRDCQIIGVKYHGVLMLKRGT